MAEVRPASLRLVSQSWSSVVPSPAHDAMTHEARRAYLAATPSSYLGVTRGPTDLAPGQHMTNEELLGLGRQALDSLIDQGAFGPIRPASFYLYQLQSEDHSQTAIIGNLATENFADGTIRLHELVQLDRATHLSRHLSVVGAQSSPIAVAHRGSKELDSVIERLLDQTKPILVLPDSGGLSQRIWAVTDAEATQEIQDHLGVLTLYLIDGHHRAAAARAHQQAVGDEASNCILGAVFAAPELRNRAHHRVLCLGDAADNFVARLHALLEVRTVDTIEAADQRSPDEIAIWADGTCHVARVPFVHAGRHASPDSLGVAERLDNLDPVRLQRGILGPLLGVDGSWSGSQLSYRPGVLPVADVEEDCRNRGEILCVMRPVEVNDLLDASDDGLVLPPKSTYFEPKARSGIFVRHLFE